MAAASRIAMTAIDDAIAAGGDPGHISKALNHATHALEQIGAGRFDKVVRDYEKAWKDAQKAVSG